VKTLHYAIFAGLLAIGLAGSVLLVPGRDELGLLYFKARQYPQAQRILEQRLAAGEHSIDVAVPLADLYIQSGDVDRALALLKRFPVRPDERFALAERIGQFQQYGQLTREYLRTLEKINRLKRSEQSLRELANLYRYFNQPVPLAAVLEELIRNYPAEPADFVELANLQAIGGNFLRAATTLEQLEVRHPEAVTGDTAEFLISVLLDAGQTRRAGERARRWLARHPTANQAIRLSGLFDSGGKPAEALLLLGPFEPEIDSQPPLLAQWVHLQIASGGSHQAFERLKGLYLAQRLPREMIEPFLDLALAHHDPGLAFQVVRQTSLERLPDWLVANLADAAIAANRRDILPRMAARLPQEFLKVRPLLAVRLALARGDRADAVNWLGQAAADPHLPDSDRLVAAENYWQLGRQSAAFDQVSRLRLENLSAAEVVEAARIYQNLGKAQEAVGRFESFRARIGMAGSRQTWAGAGWALLAASAGRSGEVAKWLESMPETAVPEDLLRDLYYAASDRKDSQLALACARRLFRTHPTDAHRLLLARALTEAGQAPEAVPYLRALLGQAGQSGVPLDALEEAYTAALRGAAHAAPAAASSYRAELREFWTDRLKRPGLEEKQRLDLIYGLLDLQDWIDALPPLADLAHKRLELAPLYIESAIEAGRKPDAIAFLKAELDRNDLTAGNREPLLYALIEHGGYEVSLPYISQFASGLAGPWVAAYEDALQKLGRTSELSHFWKKRAALPGTPVEEKRSLAFKLLEAGRKDWALAIFLDLARTARPDAAEISDLLFLWGPKPGPEAAAWLEQRARESSGEDLAGWWNHLLTVGAAARVAALAPASLPLPGQGGVLLEAYLRALIQLGDKQSFTIALARELPALRDPDRAHELARLARESGFEAPAEAAYSRVLALAPQDTEALHWLASYAFFRAHYSAAERHWRVLLSTTEGAYDDNFYFAELLWRKQDHSAARIYYGRALLAIERMPAAPPEAKVKHAQSLARCGFVARSLEEFRSLLAARPDNPDLRADFAATLLDNGRYTEARRVLGSATGSGASRLVELRAQLLAATAHKKEALDLLEDFTDTHPGGTAALTGLALLDESVQRNRQAQSLLQRAAALEPENEDVQRALEDLDRDEAPQANTEFIHRTIQGAQTEDLLRIVGEEVIGSALRLHFDVDQDVVSIKSVQSPSGVVAPYAGVLRRGEASIQYETESGLRVEGDLYASDAGPGAGAAVVRPDTEGASTIRLDLNRPYWEFPESLAGGGTRSRLEVTRDMVLSPRISASLTAALNRYSLHQVSDAAASAAAQGRVTFRLLSRPQLSLEYNFDGEYKLAVATRITPDGSDFHPLPLVNREVHSLGMAVAGQPLHNLQATAAAGYAIDRFGGQAPFVTLKLDYRGLGRFGAGADFDRRLYFLNTRQTVTTVGGHLTFRF
jgi:cellulose synthase operon protein C